MKTQHCLKCGSHRITLQQPIQGYIITKYEPRGDRLAVVSREVISNRNYKQPIIVKCTDCLTESALPDEQKPNALSELVKYAEHGTAEFTAPWD